MKGTQRFVTSVVLVAVVVVGLLATVFFLGYKPKLGLDLQGGLSVVLTAPANTPSDRLDEAVNILRNRIDRAGVGEPQISRAGSTNILIEIPGVKDSQALLKLIGQTAQLQFRPVLAILAPTDPGYTTATVTSTADTKDAKNGTVGLLGAPPDNSKYQVGPVAVDGSEVSNAQAVVDPNSGSWSVSLTFKSTGAKQWTTLTGKQACNQGVQRDIAIVLDSQVASAPSVNSDIQCNVGITTGSTSITGNYTQTTAKNLALVLSTGALPVKLTPQQVQAVSPTLGKASLKAGLTAGILGLVLVMIYVLIYYRSLGLQTWIGLFAFSSLVYSLVVLLGRFIGWNLTLAGIAGLIVSIGITTDSYIVFFERVKEEVHQGKTLRTAVDRGFRNAFRTLWTADSVTFFAALILFILAIGSVKGFALTLGMATALDVALFLALTYPLAGLLARSPVFAQGRFIGMKRALEGTGQHGLLRKIYRSEFNIDFIGKRARWLTISGVLVGISVIALIPGIRGLQYGIDFRGGSLFQVPLTKNVTVEQLKTAMTKVGEPAAEIQIFTDQSGKKAAEIQTEALQPDAQTKVLSALNSATSTPTTQMSVTFVGKKWGSQITTKAVQGLIVFLIVVILYMSWRLEPKMAASGFIALVHDLAITAGVYAITGLKVSPATVIAILTILGYSLYDTVVVFDKIKENVILPANARKLYGEIANDSMNQVFMRSINTSLTTLLPVGSLLFVGSFLLGADTLRDLALALFVGIAAGTYSSIFVATPLLSIMKENEPRYASLRLARERAAASDAKPKKSAAAKRAGAKTAVAVRDADVEADEDVGADVDADAAPVRTRPARTPTAEAVEEFLNGDEPEDGAGANGDRPRPRSSSAGGTGTRVQPRKTNRSKRKKGRR